MVQCRKWHVPIFEATQITRQNAPFADMVGGWEVIEEDGHPYYYSDATFRATYELIPPKLDSKRQPKKTLMMDSE